LPSETTIKTVTLKIKIVYTPFASEIFHAILMRASRISENRGFFSGINKLDSPLQGRRTGFSVKCFSMFN